MFDAIDRVFVGRDAWDIARDAIDVALVAYLIYRLLLIVRGTRAMQMGVGLGMILLVYLGAKSLGFVTLQSLLSYVLSSIILIVIVVFQNDIRRALIRVGGRAWFGRGRRQEQSRVIDEVVAAVTELARHRIGAIITFEQDANLLEFTKSEGVVIGSAVTRELLVALFLPESLNKLHDGALIIRDLKIARAGVFFPMPDTKVLDSSMGSRHRAALGITEETDAVVVVVSEERGTISFCFNGNIVPNLDGTALRQTLVGLLENKPKSPSSQRAPTLLPPPPPAKLEIKTPPSGSVAAIAPISPSIPPTATPLPTAARPSRVDRARAEAAHAVSAESPRSKSISLPMPRGASKSILPDDGPSSDRPPVSDRSSERPSFLAGRGGEEPAPRSEDP